MVDSYCLLFTDTAFMREPLWTGAIQLDNCLFEVHFSLFIRRLGDLRLLNRKQPL